MMTSLPYVPVLLLCLQSFMFVVPSLLPVLELLWV